MPVQIKNVQLPGREEWVDDEGIRLVAVHLPNPECDYGCALHSPSDHEYVDCPLIWSSDEEMFLRKTESGLIPDPDEVAFRQRESGKRYVEARKRQALYPQADNVQRVRNRLTDAGYDGRTAGDGAVLDALYDNSGSIMLAAVSLIKEGFSSKVDEHVPAYRYRELEV